MSTPGWYPQPDGNERYYDGTNWTEQVRAAQGAPQPPGPMAPQAPEKKKGGAMKWIAIIVGGLILLCCAGAALSMGGDDDASSDISTTESSDDTETAEASETSKAAAAKPSASKSASKSPSATKKPAPAAPAGADVKVTAGAIIKEFEENELAADQKYKGKTVEVSGVVEKIDTELFNDDKYLLNITDGGEFEFLSVTCHDMDTQVLSTLNVGNPVKVIGDFDDGGDLGVDLKNCKLAS